MKKLALLSGVFAALSSAPAWAEGDIVIGKPAERGVGFQPAVTELARDLQSLDWLILVIITVICLFVTGLLAWCIVRFNQRRNPTPGTFTHNTPLEIAWTLIPVLVLFLIGAFSLPVLFKQQVIPEGEVVIKVTGNKWYWDYEYVGTDIAYSGIMLGKEELEANGYEQDEYLLATDTAVVVPVDTVVVMQVTGADVIHSWTIPAFGVKQDAVPGRLAELWFEADQEGIYFGQCSELCGKDHAYMPITVKVVSKEVYAEWFDAAQEAGYYVPVDRSLEIASAN